MDELEKNVYFSLLERGFSQDTLTNNRGLIGATIDDAITQFRLLHIGSESTLEEPQQLMTSEVVWLSVLNAAMASPVSIENDKLTTIADKGLEAFKKRFKIDDSNEI